MTSGIISNNDYYGGKTSEKKNSNTDKGGKISDKISNLDK
jgi:hypothetical protein